MDTTLHMTDEEISGKLVWAFRMLEKASLGGSRPNLDAYTFIQLLDRSLLGEEKLLTAMTFATDKGARIELTSKLAQELKVDPGVVNLTMHQFLGRDNTERVEQRQLDDQGYLEARQTVLSKLTLIHVNVLTKARECLARA